VPGQSHGGEDAAGSQGAGQPPQRVVEMQVALGQLSSGVFAISVELPPAHGCARQY
jgi:hypothetical protein